MTPAELIVDHHVCAALLVSFLQINQAVVGAPPFPAYTMVQRQDKGMLMFSLAAIVHEIPGKQAPTGVG